VESPISAPQGASVHGLFSTSSCGGLPGLLATFPVLQGYGCMGLSCIDVLCSFLLAIAITLPNGLWASVCRWPFLLELGRISHCLYVIHQAVNLMGHEFLLGASPRFMDGRSVGVTILAAALAYGLARLSWIFFEHPLLRRGHAHQYFSRPPALSAGSEHDPITRTSV
jgi:peptidoglycan/LPS O-acetylase OafA/YrhL